MKGLTRRQKDILEFIESWVQERGYSPSYREIAAHFSIRSVAAVHKHVQRLKGKGALEDVSGSARSLHPLESVQNKEVVVDISFMGDLSKNCGLEFDASLQTIKFPQDFFRMPQSTYAIRIKDQSFSQDMLFQGDLIFVEGRSSCESGETVLCKMDGGEMLFARVQAVGDQLAFARLYRDDESLVDFAQVTVVGVVTLMMRHY